MQIFESAPQQWGTAKLDDAQVQEFRDRKAESGIDPVFIHGKYLMNLASADSKIFKTSTSTLRSSLNIAGRIGAEFGVRGSGAGFVGGGAGAASRVFCGVGSGGVRCLRNAVTGYSIPDFRGSRRGKIGN